MKRNIPEFEGRIPEIQYICLGRGQILSFPQDPDPNAILIQKLGLDGIHFKLIHFERQHFKSLKGLFHENEGE